MRTPSLLSLRQGRVRTARASIVWHDTPDGALAEAGLVLSQGGGASRGQWRLERRQDAGWLPGHAAPFLAEGPAPGALGHRLPDGLAPMAAFHGTRRLVTLDGGAWLAVLDGTLRGVVQDRPACRLYLHGEAAEMAALALRLGEAVRLSVPRAALAAEAACVATGREPVRPRGGAPAIPPGSSVGGALCLAVAQLADTILHWAGHVPGAQSPEPVHQMRVAIRRLRSALGVFRRVVQPASGPAWLDELDGALRSLAAALGAARDWDVFLAETGAEIAEAFAGDRRIDRLLAEAGRRRAASYAALAAHLQDAAWTKLQLTLALLPTAQPWLAQASPEQASQLAAPVEPFAAHALDRRLKQVVAPGKSVTHLSAEALHDVRKHAKRLRYATEFFAPLFSAKQVRRYLPRLERLQEVLGGVNDTAVAAGLMAQLGGGADRAFASGVVQGFGAGRSAHASRRVERAWSRFLRAAPFWA